MNPVTPRPEKRSIAQVAGSKPSRSGHLGSNGVNVNFLSQKVDSVTVIGPTKRTIAKVRQALHLIRRIDPREYRNVNARMKTVFITHRTGFTNEFFMPERVWFANISIIEKNDVSWIASLIVHEAFHATQFKRGRYILPLTALEAPALRIQERFLKRAGDQAGPRATREAKRQRYWAPMRKDAASAACFRNLLTLLEKGRLNIQRLPSLKTRLVATGLRKARTSATIRKQLP